MKGALLRKIFNLYHYLWALGSAIFYRFPSRMIIVIGITGTTGKSTTVEMIAAILEGAGFKVASSSSIRFKIGQTVEDNLTKQTMLGRGHLQKFLRQAVGQKCRYAILEVTSEGIRQYRHRFINFDVAVLTNLAPEHTESHGGFENYKKAKLKLFESVVKSPIKNLNGKRIQKYIIVNRESDHAPEFLKYDNVGKIEFDSHKKDIIDLKLLGDFWNLNANIALAVVQSQGIERKLAAQSLNSIESIPGRMEEIKGGQDFRIFIDYAHTPDALKKVYEFLSLEIKKSETNQLTDLKTSKLICVLGAAGGGRDKWKRPVFGELAARYCDRVFVTNEDPYDENPEIICKQIISGFSQVPSSKFQVPSSYDPILDRKEAIKKSIQSAESGDIVIITGKGCEPWMMFEKGTKIPWDDRNIVREILQNYPRV